MCKIGSSVVAASQIPPVDSLAMGHENIMDTNTERVILVERILVSQKFESN